MFSFSQIKTYQTCPKQYEFNYLNDFENEQNESLFLLQGNLLHDALRRLYQRVSLFATPSSSDLLAYFHTQRTETLPRHNFLDLQDPTVSEAYRQTSQLLTTYYHQHFPFSDEIIIGLEQKLFAKLDDQFTFSATIDRIAKKGDSFIIYDYKTNKNLPAEIEQSHLEQMYLYARVVQENYGKYFSQLKIQLEYLALGKTKTRTVDPTELQTVLDKYSAFCAEITTKKEQFKNLHTPDIFPATKGDHCKRCAFMEICPAFTSQSPESQGGSAFSSSSLNEESVQHLVREYAKDYESIRVLEEEKEAIKAKLEAFFASSEYQRIF
jgi:RecB family exonuclease